MEGSDVTYLCKTSGLLQRLNGSEIFLPPCKVLLQDMKRNSGTFLRVDITLVVPSLLQWGHNLHVLSNDQTSIYSYTMQLMYRSFGPDTSRPISQFPNTSSFTLIGFLLPASEHWSIGSSSSDTSSN